MKKLLLIAFIALFFVAASAEKSEVEQLVEAGAERIDEINFVLNTMSIPTPLKQLFGNETVNVFVKMESGKMEKIGIRTKDAKIEEIKYRGLQKPTLNVFVSEETVREIIASEEPVQEIVKALQTGKISYHGVGIFNMLKFGFFSIVQTMLSAFGVAG